MIARIAAVMVLFSMTVHASAAERPTRAWFAGVSCEVVRYYVAKYNATTAEVWARKMGATDTEIESARRCLLKREFVASKR